MFLCALTTDPGISAVKHSKIRIEKSGSDTNLTTMKGGRATYHQTYSWSASSLN